MNAAILALALLTPAAADQAKKPAPAKKPKPNVKSNPNAPTG